MNAYSFCLDTIQYSGEEEIWSKSYPNILTASTSSLPPSHTSTPPPALKQVESTTATPLPLPTPSFDELPGPSTSQPSPSFSLVVHFSIHHHSRVRIPHEMHSNLCGCKDTVPLLICYCSADLLLFSWKKDEKGASDTNRAGKKKAAVYWRLDTINF